MACTSALKDHLSPSEPQSPIGMRSSSSPLYKLTNLGSRRIDFGLSFVPTSINWRLPIALQLLFSVLLFTGVWFLPECMSLIPRSVGAPRLILAYNIAPRWLLHHGHHVEGQRVIAALAGTAYDSEATQLQTRLITQSIEQSHEQGAVRKRNLFTNGPTQHFREFSSAACQRCTTC